MANVFWTVRRMEELRPKVILSVVAESTVRITGASESKKAERGIKYERVPGMRFRFRGGSGSAV